MLLIIVGFILFGTAVNADADCNVIPMSKWAGEESHRKDVLQNPVDMVVVQHTVTPEPDDDGDCDNIVKAIRNFHMEKMNFDDIAQSFLICGNGKVYEGAGWDRVGAHTRFYNKKSIGISFIGNFESKLPTHNALNAALDLLTCGVKNNHLIQDYVVVGHRQVSNTMSPGDMLQNELKNWPHWRNELN